MKRLTLIALLLALAGCTRVDDPTFTVAKRLCRASDTGHTKVESSSQCMMIGNNPCGMMTTSEDKYKEVRVTCEFTQWQGVP